MLSSFKDVFKLQSKKILRRELVLWEATDLNSKGSRTLRSWESLFYSENFPRNRTAVPGEAMVETAPRVQGLLNLFLLTANFLFPITICIQCRKERNRGMKFQKLLSWQMHLVNKPSSCSKAGLNPRVSDLHPDHCTLCLNHQLSSRVPTAGTLLPLLDLLLKDHFLSLKIHIFSSLPSWTFISNPLLYL